MALSGCSADNPVEVGPAQTVGEVHLRLTSGGAQTNGQGMQLPDPLVISALDEAQAPVAGVKVLARIEGGGRLDGELETDSEGTVRLRWTLGTEYQNAVIFRVGDGPELRVPAVATYRYFRPAQDSDGWPVAAIDTTRATPLFRSVDRIRSGFFTEIHSLLVVHSGQLTFEAYFPGQNSNGSQVDWSRFTLHEVQSASKSFRSAMIGIAIDKGVISDVTAPLADFFPDHAQRFVDGKERITLEHVLTMSSGLEWDESGAAAGGTQNSLSRMYAQPASTWTTYVLSQPLRYDPGTRWVYNTGASLMLTDIIQRASGGETIADWVHTNYAALVESPPQAGRPYQFGAAFRPREMAKLGQVFLGRGMWKDARVLSEAWVDASLTERFAFGGPGDTAYGYQWWMRTLRTSAGTYLVQYASGNGGQYIILVPDLDLVVVSTGGNFGSVLMDQIWTIMEEGVLPAFGG